MLYQSQPYSEMIVFHPQNFKCWELNTWINLLNILIFKCYRLVRQFSSQILNHTLTHTIPNLPLSPPPKKLPLLHQKLNGLMFSRPSKPLYGQNPNRKAIYLCKSGTSSKCLIDWLFLVYGRVMKIIGCYGKCFNIYALIAFEFVMSNVWYWMNQWFCVLLAQMCDDY